MKNVFCSNNLWCDLKGLSKYFIKLLKWYSRLARVAPGQVVLVLRNHSQIFMVVAFTVSCRDHFNPHQVYYYWSGNSLVVYSSTPERELKSAIATWNNNEKFKNSEWNILYYNLTASLTLPFYCIFSNLRCSDSLMFYPK